MRILILNWRDIKNPMAGGAEVLTHELAKRFVSRGHKVTLFTSSFPGAPARENVDGIRIIRQGQWWNVQAWAFFYYVLSFHRLTDIIIDEVHWFPFFSVLYARKKTVLLVCEVARRFFFRLFPFPLAVAGRGVERFYFFLNRSVPVLTISPSTKYDLIDEGINEEHITVIPMGLTLPLHKPHTKEAAPTFLFVGRLHPLKGVVDAIDAFALICHELPSSRLWIVGTGTALYVETLRARIAQLKLVNQVLILGYLEEKDKFERFERAHILIVPSFHEGWGLVAAEAASQGTPAVAYNTAGLRDVITDGVTGVLVERNTPDSLAAASVELFRNKKRYRLMQREGMKRAKKMSWDKTATAAITVLQSVL